MCEVYDFTSGRRIVPVSRPVPPNAVALIFDGLEQSTQGAEASQGVMDAHLLPKNMADLSELPSLYHPSRNVQAVITSLGWEKHASWPRPYLEAGELISKALTRGIPVALFNDHSAAVELAKYQANVHLLPADTSRIRSATANLLRAYGLVNIS